MSETRAINKTKITNRQMILLDQIVTKNPGISARRALKRSIGLRVTVRTVRNYLNRLGWHVIERNTVSLYQTIIAIKDSFILNYV